MARHAKRLTRRRRPAFRVLSYQQRGLTMDDDQYDVARAKAYERATDKAHERATDVATEAEGASSSRALRRCSPSVMRAT